ncbi:LysR family transcriptional regulator [Paraburkholderia terrae]|uniref:LysR family transcriptional regulator n=1 Tax=Paraburkholderia terrae TaxID=311230 RepID=UPI00296AFFAA|nr:LysR family transcriptional regulator [Paraburkholderia terrae]MDW3658530.1 LysR family transcriptional regulator [Paraburkholderia terrae]
MNFTHLYAFFAVARAGTVSAGSEYLKVSQPAVTREIKELERRLGTQLFDRMPRGVVLTEAGCLLMRYATQIFALADSAELELRELAGLSGGHLDLAASATVGVYLVPQLLSDFHAQHPAVSVSLSVSNSQAVQSAISTSELGLGFIEGSYDPSKLDSLCLGYDEIIAVTTRTTSCIGKTTRAADLVMGRTILREKGSGVREAVDAAYAQIGLTIEPVASVSNTEAIKQLLCSTPGSVSFLSRMSVLNELSDGVFEEIDLNNFQIGRHLHLVWLRGRSLSRAASLFKAMVSRSDRPSRLLGQSAMQGNDATTKQQDAIPC